MGGPTRVPTSLWPTSCQPEKTKKAKTVVKKSPRSSCWASLGDSQRDHTEVGDQDVLREGCTETHQVENSKIKANDKLLNVLITMLV